jgi:type III restriction enzyme
VPRFEAKRPSGSTAEIDFWTSKPVREVVKSHVNYVVADTAAWEQAGAYYIDRHERVEAFVKNQGLGFAVPYVDNGQPHDYVPDFIIRLNTGRNLVLETKGYDPKAEIKIAAAERWTRAVNADGTHGEWAYAIARNPNEIPRIIDSTVDPNFVTVGIAP